MSTRKSRPAGQVKQKTPTVTANQPVSTQEAPVAAVENLYEELAADKFVLIKVPEGLLWISNFALLRNGNDVAKVLERAVTRGVDESEDAAPRGYQAALFLLGMATESLLEEEPLVHIAGDGSSWSVSTICSSGQHPLRDEVMAGRA